MLQHEQTASRKKPSQVRLLVGTAIAAAAALFIGANVHLVYVAMTSQPDCVAHARAGEAGPGAFGAAKSAC